MTGTVRDANLSSFVFTAVQTHYFPAHFFGLFSSQGYGDVYPLGWIARSLACIQMLIAWVYNVIFIRLQLHILSCTPVLIKTKPPLLMRLPALRSPRSIKDRF